jgi:hypothetical protein
MKVSQLIAALRAEDPDPRVVVLSLTGVGLDSAGQIYRIFLADADPECVGLTHGQFTLSRKAATPGAAAWPDTARLRRLKTAVSTAFA